MFQQVCAVNRYGATYMLDQAVIAVCAATEGAIALNTPLLGAGVNTLSEHDSKGAG